MTGELANVPAVLSGFDQSVRARPPAELVDYVFNRFQGMFRPFQNRNELQRFIERASTLGARTVVEIGTARGGTLFLLSCCADPAARIVSVDLPAGPFGGGYPSWKGHLYRRIVGRGQKLHLVRGNSHKESTFNEAVQALNGAAVDILFIDGDHSYAGAKQDFLRYRSLVRPGGLVIFHDILENVLDKDITVAPLWREIKQSFETEEIVDSYDQGRFGIGVVTAPADWEAPVALA
jgi:predicted O-methyltransferase YrrM